MQSHASNEELLNYRAQALLTAELKQHIETCSECMQGIEALDALSELLNNSPVPEMSNTAIEQSWEKISSGVDANLQARASKPKWLALAASAVFAVLITVQVFNSPEPREQTVSPLVEQPIQAPDHTSSQAVPELDRLVAYSRVLENRLQALPQPRVVRANTAGTISQLQDQISMLDTRLSMQHKAPLTVQQRNVLWQQRVTSMNNLYRVRTAQLQRVSY